MLRVIFGWLIIAHAFAHASAGVWSGTQGTMWTVTAVWTVAFLALLCAGLGLLRVPILRRRWHDALGVGCAASALMIVWYRPPLGMIGIALDFVILIAALGAASRRFDSDIAKNADRIHPEWQQRAVGDTVIATQASYLGGRFGRLGWRINVLEPERVIGLESWGTFVLVPVDSSAARLIVRTRGAGGSSALGFVFAPVDVFVFEPAHFIMERAMLRGIRDRAERASRT